MNERVVETEFVFDRHAATDVSVAYSILVPQRRARIARAGQVLTVVDLAEDVVIGFADDWGVVRPRLVVAGGAFVCEVTVSSVG